MQHKKDLPLLSSVEMTDISAEGRAVGRHEGRVVFVRGLVPGDVADVEVIKKKKNFFEARPVRILHQSTLRTLPFCPHFGTCGGCKWQHLRYEEQLKYKFNQVKEQLERIGKVQLPAIEPILASPLNREYRNKLEFTFSSRRWLTRDEMNQKEAAPQPGLGFHIEGCFDKVLDIRYCALQPEPSNAIRNALRDFALDNDISFFDLKEQTGCLRNLIIRTSSSGEVMVIVVFYSDDPMLRTRVLDFLNAQFPQITSLYYAVNPKRNDSLDGIEVVLYSGQAWISETMGALQYCIGPASFFQVNVAQARRMYEKIAAYASLSGTEIVYDLYSGIGSIALYLASAAQKIIGIEYLHEAVEYARRNATLNQIRNAVFFPGDLHDVFTPRFCELHGRPDVVITDPPRAGMHEKVIRQLHDTQPSRIIYVSCNPATQARDIALLTPRYKVTAVQPVDMFPHTFHVESVVLLTLTDS